MNTILLFDGTFLLVIIRPSKFFDLKCDICKFEFFLLRIQPTTITFKTQAAGNCMFKVNNRNIRARCEICSKLTIETAERRHWRHSGVSIVNFEHISHLVLVFLLLTLNR